MIQFVDVDFVIALTLLESIILNKKDEVAYSDIMNMKQRLQKEFDKQNINGVVLCDNYLITETVQRYTNDYRLVQHNITPYVRYTGKNTEKLKRDFIESEPEDMVKLGLNMIGV